MIGSVLNIPLTDDYILCALRYPKSFFFLKIDL